MKLDPKTVNVLKNFSTINPSLLFKEGTILETMAPNKGIIAKAVVPDTFPKRFAIYNLTKILGCMSLINEPNFDFSSKCVKISGNQTTINVTYADESSIITPPEKGLKDVVPAVSVKLTDGALREVIRASGVLQLPEIAFVGDGSNITLQALNSKKPGSDSYSVVLSESNKIFKAIFKVENMVKLMSNSYDVNISDKGFSHLIGPDIEYWVSVEHNSTFS